MKIKSFLKNENISHNKAGDIFISACHLKNGDRVLLSNGNCATIESINVEKLSEFETTYNFEVEGYHTYYVSDSKVLVHNTCERAALRAAKRSENIPMSEKPI
ncbi:MAG: hypothetical protein IKC91_01320, partial [Clostridia bacterium]|nr:hypothetical protein [Clostridia bacterium]